MEKITYRQMLQAMSNPAKPTNPESLLSPDRRHYAYKEYMLGLINAERRKAGVPPVTLGDNIAAQLHAEASLANCFMAHWGVDGLKPYMRYSLAGGYQANGENGYGLSYCIKASDGYRALGSIESEIWGMMDGWMNSPGHRRNLLDQWHKKVNIGLAWNKYNIWGYQHFEGDYVKFDKLPEIRNGKLYLLGRAINGLWFPDKDALGLQIYYDPPPHSLTRGQILRTYCYDSGFLIAVLVYPLTGNSYRSINQFTATYTPCPNPYDVPASTPPPGSPDESHRLWRQAYNASNSRSSTTVTAPCIVALEWIAQGTAIAVIADIRDLLSEHGPGIYTVLLRGKIGGQDIPVSQYSIFHEVKPPDTYNPARWQ